MNGRRSASAHSLYLAATLLIVSISGIRAVSSQGTLGLSSYGTITYPTGFMFGVCAHPWALIERDFQEMKTLGVKYCRMDFLWSDFERVENVFVYSKYDTFLAWARTYGIKIIPVLLSIPTWFPGGGGVNIPAYGADFDKFVTKYGQFIYNIVDRYKADIAYYEIWNEVDAPNAWNDPDATITNGAVHGEATKKYVRLLNEAYARAKAADPNCKVVSSATDTVYLTEMYANAPQFDLLAAHPYFIHNWELDKNYDVDYFTPTTIPSYSYMYQFGKIQYLRTIMVANGDSAKKILITEIGISDQLCPLHTIPAPSVPAPEGHTTQEMQADRLTRIFQKTLQEYPWVQGIMWYQLKDTHKAFGSVPVTDSNWGLFRMNGSWDPDYPNVIDYTPRPMYYAYKQLLSAYST